MKKILILLFLFSIPLFSQIMTPEKVISMMSNRFASMNSFSSSFTERNGSKIKTGTLISKNPNIFKLEYSGGTNSDSIYCDGKTLWMIFPRKGISRLISKYNIDFYSDRALRPVSSFDGTALNISGYNSSQYTGDDNRLAYHMLLTPKQASVDRTGFPTIHLWIAEDGMIIRILGISTTNVPVEYLFKSIRYNVQYDNKTFVPVIPEEMQVLKDGLISGN